MFCFDQSREREPRRCEGGRGVFWEMGGQGALNG